MKHFIEQFLARVGAEAAQGMVDGKDPMEAVKGALGGVAKDNKWATECGCVEPKPLRRAQEMPCGGIRWFCEGCDGRGWGELCATCKSNSSVCIALDIVDTVSKELLR